MTQRIAPAESAFRGPELEEFFDSICSTTNALSDKLSEKHGQVFSRCDLLSAFAELETRLATYREARGTELRKTARSFNVFDYIAPNENLLSDVLRLLLDPGGTHGQGDTFLRSLTRRANSTFGASCQEASVVREAVTYSIQRCRRRIDVLATLPDFILAIENKKFAGEGTRQIEDYCEHLRNIAGENFCLIFLTRTGSEAVSIAPEISGVLRHKGQLKCSHHVERGKRS